MRLFTWYLESHGYVSNQNLHLTLSFEIADCIKIVDVLDDKEIKSIYGYRDNSNNPIEIRNTAMVLLGLRLGLRASDVINLKFKDIDWKNKSVLLIQEKTLVSIVLPLHNEVGNAVYRYIKSGRPDAKSEYVFIRSRAPYGKATSKICNNALYAILPKRKAISRVGFHSLRRTFATTILRRNAGIERVIDSLGH